MTRAGWSLLRGRWARGEPTVVERTRRKNGDMVTNSRRDVKKTPFLPHNPEDSGPWVVGGLWWQEGLPDFTEFSGWNSRWIIWVLRKIGGSGVRDVKGSDPWLHLPT